MTESRKPFMSQWRRDAIKREYAEKAARRRRSSGGSNINPLTDPANPASVYYQTNHFYPDGSHTSETSSGCDSSSNYDSGASSSSSSDCGGGSYGE